MVLNLVRLATTTLHNRRFASASRPGVVNLSLGTGQKQALQGMAGRTKFSPSPFPLLFMMLLKLGNFYRINS